jgi:xanthine dehydrogenase YagR molybdenum-binding subunit
MEKYFFDTAKNAGEPVDRIEARQKVTGTAKYAAEYKPKGLTYGVLVTSTIAKGRIKSIESKKAEGAPGVLAVLTHLNRPEVPGWKEEKKEGAGEGRVEGQEYRVFYDDKIFFDHQPVALVIADTLERASHAADLVTVRYEKEMHQTDMRLNQSKAKKPKRGKDYLRGTANAYQTAQVKIEAVYHTPWQVHNPMEMHAATVVWDAADKITDYSKTQASKMAQKDIMTAFHLKEKDVYVQSPFVGGAFGSSSRIWPQEMAAILGSKKTGRPITVMARRDQVFNMVGYRPESIQKIGIGANTDGKLTGITHEAMGSTSSYEEFTERITDPTQSFYACENVNTTYKIVSLDMSTPCWTRGPGETSGSFALESALDELSYSLKMDPVELRLKNISVEKDPAKNLPWSSNYAKECFQLGAERFGWNKRDPIPRSMRSGEWLVGVGVAGGIYHANRQPATASVTLRKDGTLLVKTSVADTGPGSATIMTQIAAESFGTDISKVTFEWGNSGLPPAPGQFGSITTASTGSAVHDVVKALLERLKELAVNSMDSPFNRKRTDELFFENTMLTEKKSSVKFSYNDILELNNLNELTVTKESKSGNETEQFSGMSFCAHFVELLVHPTTGVVKMNRVVSAIDAGRIMNTKTATNQVYGSVAWGIGIALMEEGIVDHRYGRYVNNNLADYHEPVNSDIPPIDVIFIDKPDPILDPMGSKGLGEVGLVGCSAAIANAVYHATGKRIRSLPITADKIL